MGQERVLLWTQVCPVASERGTTMEVGPSAGFVVQPCGLDTELLTVPRYNSSHQSLTAGKAVRSSSMMLARHPPLPIMPRVLYHSRVVQKA